MTAKQQINVLANYIMAEVPGEPSRSEGAGDTAIRLLTKYRSALISAKRHIGVPGDGYPDTVANAYRIVEDALGSEC